MKHANKVAGKKETIWNTRKKNGWIKFKEKTENNEELLRASETKENPDKIMAIIDKEITSIKQVAFGKYKSIQKIEIQGS